MLDEGESGTLVEQPEQISVARARLAPPPPQPEPDQARVKAPPIEPDFSPFPELDCVRDRLPAKVIAAAERRAAAIGVGADRVLITAGAITEEDYSRALSARYGLFYVRLADLPREVCPLADDDLIHAATSGVLPLRAGGEIVWVVAPRDLIARRLCELVDAGAALPRLCLTSTEQLRAFVTRYGAVSLGRRAAQALTRAQPLMSAAPRQGRRAIRPVAALAALALIALALAPRLVIATVDITLAILFIAWIVLRMFGTLARRPPAAPGASADDTRLPTYTIIAALYHEAAAVEGLVQAISAFDYPKEKLDVKLVLEADDWATRAAVRRLNLTVPFEIVIAPDAGPRTKPKALNAALPLARGDFTVVYDAEDRPAPDQLRRAFDTFHSSDAKLACVQASLTIDNTADGWIARLYTAEYAGQFDVFLPGLAALRLPLPLGGSSNHFRTDVLRKVGAWDPYNVTEDADLGMRLCRFGFRATAIASTTYEEAPSRIGPWLRQRTRWYKGWMQTWLVHMRKPLQLFSQLGPAGFATFQLVVGGNVLAAVVHPIFLATLLYGWLAGIPVFSTANVMIALLAGLHGTALISGYLTSIILGLLGLAHRRLLASGFVLLLTPLHWLLLSLAAWRAVWQLLLDPYRWEKTEHGLARTSRRARMSDVS